MKVNEAILSIRNAIYTFTEIVRRKLNEKPPLVRYAKDSMSLNNQIIDEMSRTINDKLKSHSLRQDNPHKVSADQLGMVSKDTIRNSLNGSLLGASVPLSRLGEWSEPMQYNLPVTIIGGVLTIRGEHPLFMNGRSYVLKDATFDFNKHYSDFRGRTHTLLIGLSPDDNYRPYISISSSSTNAETPNLMVFGTVTFDDQGNAQGWDIRKVFRLGDYRVSGVAGSRTIPVSSGRPTQPSHLKWK